MAMKTPDAGSEGIGPWNDGMNEHDQLRAVVIENRRLRAALKKLADEGDLRLVTNSLMREVSELTGMAWDNDGRL